MSLITRQDTNGVKPLLQTGELGYDNYPAGGDNGRVYVGTGSENLPLAKKAEMLAVDSKADVHIARDDNPHGVTKAQVGLGNVEDLAPADMPISSAVQAALNAKANKTDADLLGIPKAPTAAVGTNTTQLATTAYVKAEVANETYTKAQVDAKLAGQNDASEISVTPTGNLASTNVQAALVELQGDIDNRYTKAQADALLASKVDKTVFDAANLNRADKYLAAQNIANMLYTNGDLTKIRYRVDSDTDYETLSYVNGNLTTIKHYISAVLKGTTTLSYGAGNLVSAVFVAA